MEMSRLGCGRLFVELASVALKPSASERPRGAQRKNHVCAMVTSGNIEREA